MIGCRRKASTRDRLRVARCLHLQQALASHPASPQHRECREHSRGIAWLVSVDQHVVRRLAPKVSCCTNVLHKLLQPPVQALALVMVGILVQLPRLATLTQAGAV